MLELNIDNEKKLQSAVDLIFEFAVSVPLYVVAYANMCRVLTDNFKFSATNTAEKTSTSTVTFRKVLLNKCKMEFEKGSSDEKLLEEDRLKKFETEEEKKAWEEELNYREMMNRRRMLGNIRFIGGLFKLKMISENIMHDCILKLLRAKKQDSLEDQLECLCKLLSTIGKDLDHAKAKPRMDQYFVQINKIIEKKKISSRIKFALQDVMDLRVRDWVPRRDEGNPKTIDQIHREAIQKEKKEEMARQQDKLQRKLEPRGGRGGRDSPNVRSGGPSSDGWTNVAGKSNRSTTPIVASKFKLTKKVTDSNEISLGPGGGKPGAWSRKVCVNVPSRRRTSTSGCERMSNDDGSSSALQPVKYMTGPSEDTYSAPSSGAQTLVEKSQSPVALITEEKMRKTTKSTVEEYLSCGDVKEALLCIKKLSCPSMHHVFVEESICVVLEKKTEHRRLVGTLLHYFIKEQLFSTEDMCQGFASVVKLAQDLACDVPFIYKYFGEVLGPVVYDGTLPLKKVKDTLEPLVQQSKAELVVDETLSVAVELAGICHECCLKICIMWK
ncbi:eukaryotic translation initiation factor 4 gamma 3-like [Hydractinia symbiolongicarpus]|uniref:eukaryotic translation initiation factor 4 gamma 3-like n=1 Tax=Hydractinia symbiolongicarpus TaxID=13093 RepID=UPI00254CEEF9|nr:eukaryotic translation initiation factor 4 gamma 3-like [Hydractinia symbiolongicarpus]